MHDFWQINELIAKVFEYLRPIDLICIKSINKQIGANADKVLEFKWSSSPIFKDFMPKNLLKNHFTEVQQILPQIKPEFLPSNLLQFIKNLNTYWQKDCIISGSCILQFLLDEIYDDYDIDIFIDNRKVPQMINFLFLTGYTIDTIWKKNNYSKFGKYVQIMNFAKTFKGKYRIQLIIVNRFRTSPVDIVRNFDFTIVKNYFDGRHLHITNKDYILRKYDKITTSQVEKYKCAERIQKYKQRGITFELVVDNSWFNFNSLRSLLFKQNDVLTID